MLDNLVRGYHPQLGMKYQKEIKEHYHFGHIAVFPIMIPTDSVVYPKVWSEWSFTLNTFYKTVDNKDIYVKDVVEYYLRNESNIITEIGVIDYDATIASYIIKDLDTSQEYALYNCIVSNIKGNLFENKEYSDKYYKMLQDTAINSEKVNVNTLTESLPVTKDVITAMAEAFTATEDSKEILEEEIKEVKHSKRNSKK